jgi:hypothetical protein
LLHTSEMRGLDTGLGSDHHNSPLEKKWVAARNLSTAAASEPIDDPTWHTISTC